MRGRLNIWLCIKLCLLSVVILVLFAAFEGENAILGNFHWLQHSLNLLSFTSQIIILNSSTSTTRHPLSPPYPYPYKFLINQPQKCQNRKPFLVLLVMGESHNVKSRDTIRETWGNESNYGEIDVVKIFLVGLSPAMTGAIQGVLEEESAMYGDIVQQDFLDTYYNLTLKTLMGMEWVSKFCPNASYAMKVDNDVFLNVNYLVHQFLHTEFPAHENYFTGLLVYSARPVRNKKSKWYVPENVYPSDMFPPYPSGPGYVFSVDMARKVYGVAQEITVLSVEDAFVGICLYKLNILPTEPPKDLFNGQRIEYDRCIFQNVIMVHHYENEELRNVWSDFWGKNILGC
ncbi:beta-1,3-galactosyltransferase 2-like [Pseudophryne corroboree]|uniref:beta-1,3-galactosyltransferase 2-like n=1 Tax=Pseudophryne corroboree TaxID=495146 RepID=UPI00308185B5